jgi:hypothetical protein
MLVYWDRLGQDSLSIYLRQRWLLAAERRLLTVTAARRGGCSQRWLLSQEFTMLNQVYTVADRGERIRHGDVDVALGTVTQLISNWSLLIDGERYSYATDVN